MITNLREAKSSLSKLVRLAAEGEEIVITVRGQPMARLIGAGSDSAKSVSREKWASELSDGAAAANLGEAKSTPQEFWDLTRSDGL